MQGAKLAVGVLWALSASCFFVGGDSQAASIGRTGGGTAFWAHVGGFVAGAALVFLFRNRKLTDRHPYHGWNARPPGPDYEHHRGVW